MCQLNKADYLLAIGIGFFRSIKFRIILIQMVAHYILHIFLIKMTPYFLKLVNRLQSYVTFYPSYFHSLFDQQVKGHAIDIVKK